MTSKKMQTSCICSKLLTLAQIISTPSVEIRPHLDANPKWIDSISCDGYTLMIQAIQAKNFSAIEAIAERKPESLLEINHWSDRSPLHHACFSSQFKILMPLLFRLMHQHQISTSEIVKTISDGDYNPLMRLFEEGEIEKVDLMIELAAHLGISTSHLLNSSEDYTLFQVVAYDKNDEMMEWLFHHGYDFRSMNSAIREDAIEEYLDVGGHQDKRRSTVEYRLTLLLTMGFSIDWLHEIATRMEIMEDVPSWFANKISLAEERQLEIRERIFFSQSLTEILLYSLEVKNLLDS